MALFCEVPQNTGTVGWMSAPNTKTPTGTSTHFLCMIFSSSDEVLSVESLAVESASLAQQVADLIAAAFPGCRGYDLWRDGRKVSSTLRSASLLPTPMTDAPS